MSLAEGIPETRPIVFCHEGQGGISNSDYHIPFRLSEEIEAMDCLNLQPITLWVFKKGEGDVGLKGDGRKDLDESAPAQKPRGAWHKFLVAGYPSASPAAGPYVLGVRKEADPIISILEQGDTEAWSLAAFMEIPLKAPKGPDGLPVAEIKYDESWIFPIRIRYCYAKGNLLPMLFIYRDLGEHGEVPNWAFLEEHYGDDGYKTVQKVSNKGRQH